MIQRRLHFLAAVGIGCCNGSLFVCVRVSSVVCQQYGLVMWWIRCSASNGCSVYCSLWSVCCVVLDLVLCLLVTQLIVTVLHEVTCFVTVLLIVKCTDIVKCCTDMLMIQRCLHFLAAAGIGCVHWFFVCLSPALSAVICCLFWDFVLPGLLLAT